MVEPAVMSTEVQQSGVVEARAPVAVGRGSALRWWVAVGVGAVLMAPAAVVLSLLAALPFFLGLFFFALFGLVIGAIMFRIASPRAPLGQAAVITGTTLLVVGGWALSIAVEAIDFPRSMAYSASAKSRDIGGHEVREYRVLMQDNIREHLRSRYAPGGVLGYVRWVLTDGQLRKGEVPDLTVDLKSGQVGWVWGIRAAASVALLGFGLGSMVLPLSREARSTVPA